MATQYVQDKEGNTFIASTQRADGSFRKPRKVKQGFVPQEEVPLYESKGKKIAKEAKENEGLPSGLTREAWEKMKEAQANLLNTQQKAAKKKNNKKKTANQSTDNQNENQLNNQLDENKTAAAKKKKNKNKTQQNNENNSATVNNTTSISPTNEKPIDDDWVTMGKSKPKPQQQQKSSVDKATSGVKNLSLNNKQKNKQSQQQSKPTIDDLPISKEVDDLASGMLIDDYHEDEKLEKLEKEKNNEKQLLIKKIKTLKKKLKDVESLKELAKQKSLDKDQQQKLNKSADFAKELTKLQSKLELINKDK